MKNAATADGLNAQFYEDENTSTGVRTVCLVGGARAWVVDPSAALNYKSDHLKRPENWASVEKAKYFFVSGSFLATSTEPIQILGKHAAENNKVFIMSLGSPFICVWTLFLQMRLKQEHFQEFLAGRLIILRR